MEANINVRNYYHVEALDAEGNLKWTEDVKNLTTNQGLNDLLTQYFKGSSYSASWNVGLYGGTGTLAAGDTLASHAGWTEITAYSGNRPALTLGSVASQSVDNSASVAVFNMTGGATILGAFVCAGATGTSGVLYGEAAFSSSRTVASGDTVNVTVTLTAATA